METPPINNSLKLESLKNDYSLAIIEYDNAYKNFMELIKQPGDSLKQINNSKIIGEDYKSTFLIDNVDDCLHDCVNDKTCSGLDYSEKNNRCNFFTGNLAITKSDNSKSYIKNINPFYLTLLETNTKLNNIVSEINELLEKIDPETKEELEYKTEEIVKLNIQYKSLEEKNKIIKNLINTNTELNNEYDITNLMINRSSFTYFLWVLLLIIILIFIIKYVFYS